jgi:hypothetical protein
MENTMKKITDRNELISLVQRIIEAEGTEEEQDEMLLLLKTSVPDPNVSDLIYYPSDGQDLSAEEVVDRALAYKPIQL